MEFEAERGRMFGVAYRMVGTVSDAEDIVQEAYLRWQKADRGRIREPAAWLTKVIVNLALTHLASARIRRERYVGAWLPEPLLTPDPRLGPAEAAEQRESLALGVLIVLERLTPPERAVYVLREALAYSHREIADVLEITEEYSRQLLRRAREHMRDSSGKARMNTPEANTRVVVERFVEALRNGDAGTLEHLLSKDVTSTADGGGKVTAARRPVLGRSKVLRYLLGLRVHPKAVGVEQMDVVELNGQPGVLVIGTSGSAISVVVPRVNGNQIHEVLLIVNPDKLAYLDRETGR
ncbi:RNA polymerase sigma factor SigJ [Brevibacterium picturae]|uniref:RNA polymerase sigma factor SigJ n=1 Tax=Brevibacterium picturae TaxID=260553 RepID=A0ABN2BUD0_9MICO